MPQINHFVGRVRIIGIAEGLSYLLLLGIAMPLKYAAGFPGPVKYMGWIHGLLFILYCLVIFHAWWRKHLGFKRAALAFGASLIPFGPWLIDRRLAVDEENEGTRHHR